VVGGGWTKSSRTSLIQFRCSRVRTLLGAQDPSPDSDSQDRQSSIILLSRHRPTGPQVSQVRTGEQGIDLECVYVLRATTCSVACLERCACQRGVDSVVRQQCGARTNLQCAVVVHHVLWSRTNVQDVCGTTRCVSKWQRSVSQSMCQGACVYVDNAVWMCVYNVMCVPTT